MICKRSKRFFVFALTLALVGLAVSVRWVQAAPAAPVTFPVTQPDGTEIMVRMWGDEFQHGYETTDGYTIVKDLDSQYWVYANKMQDGNQASSDLIVGKSSPEGLEKHVRTPAALAAEKPENNGPTLRGQNQGMIPLLVLLVSFSDQDATYSAGSFQQEAFGQQTVSKTFTPKLLLANLTLFQPLRVMVQRMMVLLAG